MENLRSALLSDEYFQNFHPCCCEIETGSPQKPLKVFGGSHYTLCCVTKGQGNIYFENQSLTLLAGYGLLLLPGTFWRWQAGGAGCRCLRVGFSGRQAESLLKKMNFYEPGQRFFCSRPRCLEDLAEEMLQAARGTLEEILQRQSLFYEFLSVLMRDFKVEDHLEGGLNPYVARAVGWIREHYEDPRLRVADMARYLGISRNYLFSLFKASTGCSPQEYITGFRLNRARELLVGTEYSIEIISGSCGYENPEAFSRAFKKKYRTTPLRYRGGVIKEDHNLSAGIVE